VILFNTYGYASGSGWSGMGTRQRVFLLDAISGWGGRIVVVRAHIHDPEAHSAAQARELGGEAALVVEAVVWPSLPDQIGGEPRLPLE